MEPSFAGPPDSVVKALSKPNGRSVVKAAGALLSWANSKKDHALTKRSQFEPHVSRHSDAYDRPSRDRSRVDWRNFCQPPRPLGDGPKTGQGTAKAKEAPTPEDRETLRSTLQWIDAIQLDMASYWIAEIKKDLPKLLKALDKLERSSVHGTARRSQRSSARRAQ